MPENAPTDMAAPDPSAPSEGECVRAMLYTLDEHDRALELSDIDPTALGPKHLLWIDLSGCGVDTIASVLAQMQLPAALVDELSAAGGTPRLRNHGDWFIAQAVAASNAGGLVFNGVTLSIVAGPNYVLSVHAEPIAFVEQVYERERGETALGMLASESFVAALLDWHLSTYFDAVSDFEAAVERLETRILGEGLRDCLQELQRLRRAASRLRRMLAAHRPLFSGLARPDFRPACEGTSNEQFHNLDVHYERAMDMVENARELVVGTFELFTSRTAHRTNESMRQLTFLTALLGVLGVSAGILGMNFDAPLFESGARGFFATLGAMTVFLVAALIIGRRRDWF